jgi:hypothetical protein
MTVWTDPARSSPSRPRRTFSDAAYCRRALKKILGPPWCIPGSFPACGVRAASSHAAAAPPRERGRVFKRLETLSIRNTHMMTQQLRSIDAHRSASVCTSLILHGSRSDRITKMWCLELDARRKSSGEVIDLAG